MKILLLVLDISVFSCVISFPVFLYAMSSKQVSKETKGFASLLPSSSSSSSLPSFPILCQMTFVWYTECIEFLFIEFIEVLLQ